MDKSVGDSQKTLVRADLEQKLREKGFSRREAKRAVNAVLEAMKKGLAQDREVEFPLGKLKLVPHHHRQQEGKFLGRKRTIYKRRYTVVHELDRNGDALLNPPPPKPRRPALVLPPKPGEKKEEPVRKKITARGRRKWVRPPKPAKRPKLKNRRLVLPPRPSSLSPQPIPRRTSAKTRTRENRQGKLRAAAMAESSKKLVREDLFRNVQDKGFSRRLAVDMVNLLFEEMRAALIRGEEVNFPFGHLQRVKRKQKPKLRFFMNKVVTTYENPWTVALVVDEKGQKLLDEEDRRREEARLREAAAQRQEEARRRPYPWERWRV